MVVLGESADEGVHAREESVVVAHHKPLAVLARDVVVQRWEEREVSLCHLDRAVRVVHLHIHAQCRQSFSRLLQLLIGGINKTQDQTPAIGVPLPICQPVRPLMDGAGFRVHEPFVCRRDAEQEIAGIHGSRVWGLGYWDIERFQTCYVRGRALEINCVEIFGEEVLVNLGYGLALDVLGNEVDIPAAILNLVAQSEFLL